MFKIYKLYLHIKEKIIVLWNTLHFYFAKIHQRRFMIPRHSGLWGDEMWHCTGKDLLISTLRF